MVIPEENVNYTLACRWAFPYDNGGVAMHNYYLFQLLQNKMNISFISSKNGENHSFYHQKGISYSGISAPLPNIYWCLAINGFLNNGLRSLQDWRISLAIAKVLELETTDIIEFMDIHSDGYVYLKNNPINHRKIKVIIRSHTPWRLLRPYYSSDEFTGADGWWSTKREEYCFHSCDGITVPSKDLKNKLIDLYSLPKDKLTVIPNILDTDHFKPLTQERNDSPFTVLHVGRFERAKGVITLIKAFINFAKYCPNCILINVGEPRGPAYRICQELLTNSNMEGRVTFTGLIPYLKLPKYYSKADIVVIASEIYESFSYTTAQALACGKAVISSSIGGIPETLNNGKGGLLYESGNYDELTESLIYLYNNDDLRKKLEKAARRFAVKKFSIQKLKKPYLEYYKSFMN